MSQPPNNRPSASERRAQKGKASNPYATTSASNRRAQEQARSGNGASSLGHKSGLTQDQVADILSHPTRIVTTEDLRRDYSYVLRDIRNMFAVAGGLILLLVFLALVLPT